MKNRIKSLVSVVLLVSTLVLVTGCSSFVEGFKEGWSGASETKNNSVTQGNAGTADNSSQSIGEASTANNADVLASEPTKEQISEDGNSKNGKYLNDRDVLLFGTNFSEERAWVTYQTLRESGSVTTQTAVIDTHGRIIFETDPHTDYAIDGTLSNVLTVSDFADGLSYFVEQTKKDGDNVKSYNIIDKDGNITFTKEVTDNNTFEIIGYGNGMFLVKSYYADFNTNEWRLGAIDKKGNEVVPLKAYTYSSDYGVDIADFGNTSYCYYLGDNIFRLSDAYNSYSDAIVNLENQSLLAYGGNADIRFFSHFENGYALVYGQSPQLVENGKYYYEEGIYKIDTNGTIIEGFMIENVPTGAKPDNIVLDSCPIPRNGTEYTILSYDINSSSAGSFGSSAVFSDGLVYINGSYYNITGEKVIDFPEYRGKNDYTCTPFSNGYAAMMLVGADGQPYITAINKAGDLMFEPKPGYEYAFTSLDGKYVIAQSSENDTIIFDINGSPILTIEYFFHWISNATFDSASPINNGVIRIEDNNGFIYANIEDGTVLGSINNKPGTSYVIMH